MIKFPRAEAFDILGLATFGIMAFLGARAVFFDHSLPSWTPWFFLIIGVLGLVIDGSVVYRTFLRKGGTIGGDVVK